MTAAARKTSIDRTQQHRRSLLAKVHIAKKQLGLSEDDYRAIIFQHCGSMSAKDATDAQLERTVQHFVQRCFKTTAKAVPGRRAPAVDTPSARKARALLISLHQLGAVPSASEEFLEGFARRQLGVEHWRWSDQSQSYKLIEALKARARKHGWEVGDGKHVKLHASKARLVRAILAKLVDAGVAAPDWTVTEALFRLTGEEIRPIDLSMSIEEMTRAAQLLGRVLADRSPIFDPEA